MCSTVLPEVMFEASQLAVHYGETFDLTCTVRGFPANLTSIQTRYGVELINQIHGRLDAYTTRAFAHHGLQGGRICVYIRELPSWKSSGKIRETDFHHHLQ